ncbi:hypothetical protein HHI36_022473 [Cryptolaemus montrouzieri]|uniref:XPG-I domain-containing protein n=1 Tax=Cryptolaemus montrouzieri TaxID=559131 RepID=A0ABD2N057_9CUCU
MYLRNLYFRTSYLLLMEVYPIFVLEGKAPELKYDTIAARNAIQFKGAKPKTDGVKTGKDRTRFHYVLKQCQEMLKYMGLVCLTGKGEAESFCAYLNQEGLVYGCISQDSDCFAYGAQVVYRNFSISSQGSHSASGGAVDVYDIRKATSSLGFGRNKIIALALLCGSDYSEGVQGVGKDCSLKLFEKYSDEEILDRMRQWRNQPSIFEEFERKLGDKNICTSCGHSGRVQSHNKTGCKTCGTSTGCDFSKYKEERLYIKNEISVRSKALQDPNFPNEELITEYLTCKDEVSSINLKWTQPDLVNFVKFTTKHLGWEEVYSFEKFLPILTRWQLLNHSSLDVLEQTQKLRGFLYPECIKKIRTLKGVPSYEIVWSDKDNFFKGLIPDSQLLEIKDMDKFWSTIEPQNLVENAYPKLVEDFRISKIKPKKPTRRKNKKLNQIDELNNSIKNISLSEPAAKKSKKPKKKINSEETTESKIQNKKKNMKTLDSFLKKAIVNNFHNKNTEFTSTPIKKRGETASVDLSDSMLDISNFEDENESDLSDILDGIMGEDIPQCFKDKLEELGYKIEDNNREFHGENRDSASFFTNSLMENDLFQRTFDQKYMSSDEEMEDLEYLNDRKTNDSFDVPELPSLFERLKNRM